MSGSWEKSPIDVLIAQPISGWEQVDYEWHENQLNFMLNMPKELKVARIKFPEPIIDGSREKAKQTAISNGAHWLFFCDTDLQIPPDTLQRLISHDKDIVGGLYVRRHNPPFNEMLKFRQDGLPGIEPIRDGAYVPGSLVECDAIATGCMLIRTDVFEKIPPWKLTIDGQNANPAHFLWTENRLPNGMSEDFAFCVKARQAGVRIFCDTSIICKHKGPLKLLPSGNNGINLEFGGQ